MEPPIVTTENALSACSDGVETSPITRVSVDWLGRETATCFQFICKNNSHPSISADGIFMAWDSDAEVVAPGPDNPAHITQMYVQNLQTGEIRAVSAATQPGLEVGALGDDSSAFGSISGSGRYVAYLCDARNLDVDDQDNKTDVYLYSYPDDDNWRVTERPDGSGFDGHSQAPDVSFEGTVIAFASTATNVEPLVIPGCGQAPIGLLTNSSDVFVFDRNIGHFEWISATPGCEAPDGPSDQPSITYDGRYVAFRSQATNLSTSVGDRDRGLTQIFVRDRSTGEIVPVSVNPAGSLGNGRSAKPAIAGYGRYVVFESDSSDLVPGDTAGSWDIFVRDLELRTTTRVSVAYDGTPANGNCAYAEISPDGSKVLFSSIATNLIPWDETAGFLDFFVRDRDSSGDGRFDEPGDTCTRRLSATPWGEGANNRSGGNTSISDNGTVVFMSRGSNLVPVDTNGAQTPPSACSPACPFGQDIFLRTLD